MTRRDDYNGSFDPSLTLADFSRKFLVRLGHEYLLIGHMLDRVGLPLIRMAKDTETFTRSAIEEWMGASPIYSKRMQALMNFDGGDVATVFKNLQLEIGSPQQFMDFQFRLDSPEYGEFWLAHCGALLDVEPFGEDGVKNMCHDIEDPTFDATAAATHPKMVMRPVHRPPRADRPDGNGASRWPHCRWMVYIGDDTVEFEQHPNRDIVADSLLAEIDLDLPDADPGDGGWPDYSHDFDPHAVLADFSHRALVGLVQEFAVQQLLLMRSYFVTQFTHFGMEETQGYGHDLWRGHAAVACERFQRFLGIEGDDIETIAKIFQLHPHFQPRAYTDLRLELIEPSRLRVSIGDCPALNEHDDLTWFSQLGPKPHAALEAIAQYVNPRAQLHAVEDPGDARLAWDIEIDASAEPAPEVPELAIARISGGMRFEFEQRRLLRVAAE